MRPKLAGSFVLAAMLALGLTATARADLSEKLGALTGENAKGYLGPLPGALSGTLNSAIFQTGKVPKTGVTFTVGVHVMGVNLKDEDRTFVPVDPPGFTSSPSGQPVSTITGDSKSVGVTGQGGTQFNYPGGFDQSTFTLAAPELTIGSFMGTRAVVRWFSAEIGKSDYGKLELFGIGGQHSISQYMPSLPVDVAAGVFYQTFKIGDGLLDTKALHLDVTGSKSFGLIQPYVAIGYDTFKMDVDYNSTSNPGEHVSVSMDDKNSAHFTVGAQASLAIVKLHAEFNAAANTGAAIGLSFGL